MLEAYAAGFEAMGALARACHPALYDGGWHPTAVCGTAGAAVAAARLLGLDRERTRAALGLALLRAGGLRAAFGSDGKALQVGLARAAGVQAARLAAAGARVDAGAIAGARGRLRRRRFGVAHDARATLDALLAAGGAIEENWIKAYPCCLQTHARDRRRAGAPAAPAPPAAPRRARRSRSSCTRSRARPPRSTRVRDGLEAKFSIPYLTAYALLHGAPDVEASPASIAAAAALGARIAVRTDAALGADEARLEIDGEVAARIARAARLPGQPARRARRSRRRSARSPATRSTARSTIRSGRPPSCWR